MAARIAKGEAAVILGLGVDIVEIDRMRHMLETTGERLIKRIFTDGEAAYALAHAEPAMHFAARAAAKEATYKALSGNQLARAVGGGRSKCVFVRTARPISASWTRRGACDRDGSISGAHLAHPQ